MNQFSQQNYQSKQILLLISLGLTLLAVVNYVDLYNVYVAIGIAFFVFIFIRFINKIGKELPVKETTLLIFSLQFILGPFWAYYFFDPHIIYDMKVPDYEYFGFAVPAILALGAGLFIIKNRFSLDDLLIKISRYNSYYYTRGKLLIIISLTMPILSFLFPVFGFIFFLFGSFNFIGVYYILFSDSKKKLKWFIISFGIALVSSMKNGLFHELFIWGIFTLLIFSLKLQISTIKKVVLFTIGLFTVMVLESVKEEYRKVFWYGTEKVTTEKSLNLYADLIGNVFMNPSILFDIDYLESKLVRINIANITTRVMAHMPFYEPFANGETVFQAIETSLVPRVFNPDRVTSGGKDNYTRFTGFEISGGTSISIGVLSEAYANFGPKGGTVFMFFWGIFIAYSLRLMFKIIENRPELLFWFPLIFSQSIKAEIDIVHIMNHMTKSALLVYLIYLVYLKKNSFSFNSKHKIRMPSYIQQNLPNSNNN